MFSLYTCVSLQVKAYQLLTLYASPLHVLKRCTVLPLCTCTVLSLCTDLHRERGTDMHRKRGRRRLRMSASVSQLQNTVAVLLLTSWQAVITAHYLLWLLPIACCDYCPLLAVITAHYLLWLLPIACCDYCQLLAVITAHYLEPLQVIKSAFVPALFKLILSIAPKRVTKQTVLSSALIAEAAF